jgi:hypothetical protein
MQSRNTGRRMLGLIGITAGCALVFGLSIAFASAQGKVPSNPWAGLTDQQKQDQVDAVHAANVRYLQSFEASHRDARTLPVIRLDTWQAPPRSMGAAVTQASLIMHGQVKSVHFIADPTGNLPQMTATVAVADVGKGSAHTTITVRQIGGPVAQPGGKGALVELADEPLMLPGDEVVLLLKEASDGVEYRAVYGAGVQFIKNGKLAGEQSAKYGIKGSDYGTVWKALTDPLPPISLYPFQDPTS